MARNYYTLLEKTPGELYAPQFGDYDKEVVMQEMRDLKDSGSFIKGTKFKIIKTSGRQKDIAEAVEIANATER